MGAIASITVKDTIQPWKKYLETREQARGTITNKLRHIELLATVSSKRTPMLVKNLGLAQITDLFAEYHTVASRNACLQAVRGWFKWCIRMDYINPVQVEKLIGDRGHEKFERKPKYFLPVEKFMDVLSVAGARHPQRRAIMAFLLFTLVRQSELSSLLLKDVNLETRNVRVYRHKRKRYTDVPICPDLYDELMIWLTWYAEDQGFASPAELMKAHPEWHLAPSRWQNGSKLAIVPERGASRIEHFVKEVLDDLGIEDTTHGEYYRHLQEGAHTIRRSGARAMFDYLTDVVGEDKALLQVMLMLDHEQPQVTLKYIGVHIEKERLKKFLLTNSPYGFRKPPQASQGEARVIQLRPGRALERAV